MIGEELQRKIDRAIKLLQLSVPEDGSPIEIAYSGGKDSDVILQLAKESGIPFRAIYKNTTIDPPYTRKHALDMGVEVKMPKRSFFELIAQRGYPNRFIRYCCQELKEYKILDKCVMGVRRAESTKRAERYKEPTQCRYYGSKKDHVEAIYPILEWSNQDVADFINDRNIQCHRLYYDENGNFDVTRRLGCLGCPLASHKKRLVEFKEHPNMVKAYVKAGQIFLDTHPDSRAAKTYANGYEYFAREIFYKSQTKFIESKTGLFDNYIDYKKFLEDYFNIKFTE